MTAPTPPRFVACVLLHGDHPELAGRCLTPLLPYWQRGRIALRVGLNHVSRRTADLVERLGLMTPCAHVVGALGDTSPAPKYPVMRDLLDPAIWGAGFRPAPHVVWFDDDSYIRPDAPGCLFDELERRLEGQDLVGSPYRIRLSGAQDRWVRAQPWYRKEPFGPVVRFFTGGFWAARRRALDRLGYPWPELHHNGGDVMLGVAADQHNLAVDWQDRSIGRYVAINADAEGRESRSPRRGLSTPPVGHDYRP